MRQISLNGPTRDFISSSAGVIRNQAFNFKFTGNSLKRSFRDIRGIKKTVRGTGDRQCVFLPSVPYCIQLLDGPYIENLTKKLYCLLESKSARLPKNICLNTLYRLFLFIIILNVSTALCPNKIK